MRIPSTRQVQSGVLSPSLSLCLSHSPSLFLSLRVSYNTLLSIYGQKYQEMIRNTYGRHKTRAHEYFAQYREGVAADRDCDDAVLVRIAETINLAPCLLARQVVTLFFQSHEGRA